MDIRKINTINRIKHGFFQVLDTKKLSACTTSDIVEMAQISKKSFYNYFKNKDELLDKIEEDLLTGLQVALDQDRATQLDQRMTNQDDKEDHFQNFMQPELNTTLGFCNEHVNDFRTLLSANGDISFQDRILKLGTAEADRRFRMIFDQAAVSNEIFGSQNYQLARELITNVVFTIFKFWVQHYETMSLDELRQAVYTTQTQSVADIMRSVVLDNMRDTFKHHE